jgi:uncharacterized membrane protein YciS (DUF1049 family)
MVMNMKESEVSLLLTVLSMIIGAAITWLVARHYYIRAGKELKQESAELRRLTTLVLHSMEDTNLAELNRDSSGRIIGLVLKSGIMLAGSSSWW